MGEEQRGVKMGVSGAFLLKMGGLLSDVVGFKPGYKLGLTRSTPLSLNP